MLKYGHFHVNYGYVCQIVDIYNFSYIHFYVLKYEHSHINYGYACEIVDIYPCASTIRQVSVIVYRPNSMAIQWLTPYNKGKAPMMWIVVVGNLK